MNKRKGRPTGSPDLVASKHLGLRFTATERMLLDAYVHLIQKENPLHRVTLSSVIRGVIVQEAKARGFEVFRDDKGKIGLRQNGRVIPVSMKS